MCFKERHFAQLQQFFLGFLLLKLCVEFASSNNNNKGSCLTMSSRPRREHGLTSHQKQDFLQLSELQEVMGKQKTQQFDTHN